MFDSIVVNVNFLFFSLRVGSDAKLDSDRTQRFVNSKSFGEDAVVVREYKRERAAEKFESSSVFDGERERREREREKKGKEISKARARVPFICCELESEKTHTKKLFFLIKMIIKMKLKHK